MPPISFGSMVMVKDRCITYKIRQNEGMKKKYKKNTHVSLNKNKEQISMTSYGINTNNTIYQHIIKCF